MKAFRATQWKAAAALVAASMAGASPTTAAETRGLSFEQVLQIHLEAIRSRDLSAIERTLTSGERLDLLLPDGRHLRTRDEFIRLHVDWFADQSWTWRYEPVARHVGTDLATATIKTRSESRDPDGKVTRWSENWLTLTFRKEAGGWALVLDQNTPIARGP
ncbi:nuclear transport factor 2 family protein [Sphingosinicella sp. CPCC 101087]|uniref:YybH family protein n=1 Tax=Sphingosinicella sp. CPCC 101087 TaxID=2497754 RepID=UPI00101DAD8E|nr:nuclear transport factor 2 family protein [Sphingosinicella sp. CPCC 101087]